MSRAWAACDKISVSVVYSVYLTCDRCIGFDGFVCGFGFWANFLAVLRFWTIFSSVLRFLIHPNAPLLSPDVDKNFRGSLVLDLRI